MPLHDVKVKNMQGQNGPVKNQFIIHTPDGRYFQSYETVIAFIPEDGGPVVLDARAWNYSVTTGKYRNLFLGETKRETERKIKAGEYVLADLSNRD